MEVRSELDSVTTPRPYWKCLMYAPSSRAFKVPPRVEHSRGACAFGRNSIRSRQKKWPACVDLQASKKSKGLQEQQSHTYSIMRNPPHPSDIPLFYWVWNELPRTVWPELESREAGNTLNLREKKSNRRAEFAKAWSWTLCRASRTS